MKNLLSPLLLCGVLAGCGPHLAPPSSFAAPVRSATAGTHASQFDVTMAQNDEARTASNSSEIYLTTSNVTQATFGKLFARQVDATFYAQPLYLRHIASNGAVNVVYVATMHNTVYAFDADNPAASAPIWSAHLGTQEKVKGWLNGLGILSTPVIARGLGVMYVVTATHERGHRVYRLHALDLLTGKEKLHKPAEIAGSVPGKGYDARNGVVTFNPTQEIQRTSLAISGDSVYVAFAADRDIGKYHGWVFGFDTRSLRQTAIFNVTPDGGAAGIWQSGRAPVVGPDGSLYFETGNGDFDGATNFGETLLKLRPDASGALKLADWFAPEDWKTMNDHDYDLSSSGPTLIPGTNLMIVTGKTGAVYLTDAAKLGHMQKGNPQVVQQFLATAGCTTPLTFENCAQIMGQAFWSTAPVPKLYMWPVHDRMRAFEFVNGRFNTTPVSMGAERANYPGGVLAHSSYLGTTGTGVVWAITCDKPDKQFYFGPGFTGPGTLHAYDANDLTHELWNSSQNPARDSLGVFPSFTPPTIANGKVYAPSFSNQLVVYGLLNGPVPGDVNGDNVVNCTDAAIVKAAMGKSPGESGFDLRADVVRDGVIDANDLALVTQRIPAGAPCP